MTSSPTAITYHQDHTEIAKHNLSGRLELVHNMSSFQVSYFQQSRRPYILLEHSSSLLVPLPFLLFLRWSTTLTISHQESS